MALLVEGRTALAGVLACCGCCRVLRTLCGVPASWLRSEAPGHTEMGVRVSLGPPGITSPGRAP